MTIAIDFDGTCVEHKYPLIGENIPHCVRVLKKLLGRGYDLILYTMRSGKELAEASEWFEKEGIYLTGINCNPYQLTWTNSPKIYANFYIDDSAIGCPLIYENGKRPKVDWLAIEKELIIKNIL